jgi:excisionase family DNA binding protein
MQTHIGADTSAQPRIEPTDPWLTLDESAAEVKVHPATLRREIKAGRLRHARVGGRTSIRIRRSWVNAWLEASMTPVEAR